MRALHPLLAAALLTACGGSGADLPSTAKGDKCIVGGWVYRDAGRCSDGEYGLPVCFRYEPVTVEALDWMCMVSPGGKLYLYPSSTAQVFYYPGWSFGPASRTARQPAFKSTLSAKDEARCAEALVARAEAGDQEPPLLCVDPPGTPPYRTPGTVEVKAEGMTFTGPVVPDEPWSNTANWNVQTGGLTSDPSYGYKGHFYVRWRRRPTASTYTCSEAGFMFPSIAPLADGTLTYHWIDGGATSCPKPAICELTVTGVAGDEHFPTSGRFTVRNLPRGAAGCADTVDLDGTFAIPHPEL